ncbi:MAG: sugar phosphate isomerase/epimerase family protein [Omnitrophica WOR_2 bacterium]
MKIGVMVNLSENIGAEFQKITRMGFPTCQLVCWEPALFTHTMASRVRAAVNDYGTEITALWVGWEGPCVWDLVDGPETIGLVPPAYRFERIQTLLKGAEFAGQTGIPNIITHVGFIPERPADPEYPGLIQALRYLIARLPRFNCNFLFETGQETPVTLLRTIQDIGLANAGINLDPANLIMYGKANPVDALDVFGAHVRGVHAKDGLYPTGGRSPGIETPLGEGKVDFPKLIARLRQLKYSEAITIEREISGEQQIQDILKAKAVLENLFSA